MAQPKRKTSKMKKRQRKASCYNWKGVQTQLCECGAPRIPHRVCASCGEYAGRQVIKAQD
jgi:large subunit ribosomal protein L32